MTTTENGINRNGSNGQDTSVPFPTALKSFIEHINSTTKPPKGMREMFPDFKVKPAVQAALTSAIEHYKQGNFKEADAGLNNAKTILSKMQAAYTRNILQGGINNWLSQIEAECQKYNWKDLVVRSRRASEVYIQHLDQPYFDLRTASELYWKTVDSLRGIDSEIATRLENRVKREAEEAQKERDRRAAEARAREIERKARRDAEATELLELVEALG